MIQLKDMIIQLASYIQVGLSGTENKLILLHGYHGSQLALYPGPFFSFFFGGGGGGGGGGGLGTSQFSDTVIITPFQF